MAETTTEMTMPSSTEVLAVGGAALSWSGFNVYGTRASIDEVRRLQQAAYAEKERAEELLRRLAESERARQVLVQELESVRQSQQYGEDD